METRQRMSSPGRWLAGVAILVAGLSLADVVYAQSCTGQPLGTPCDADAEFCTIDECDGLGSCIFSGFHPLSMPCEADGDFCTLDHCDGAGQCVFVQNAFCPGSTGPCDGGTQCNPASGVCDVVPDPAISTPCEADGDFCTLDHCDGAGQCVFVQNAFCPGSTGPCDGGTQCNPASGACDVVPDPTISTPCEADGDFCTLDHCDGAGQCVFVQNAFCPGSTGACDGGTQCNPASGACDPLPHAPAGTTCNTDGDACTLDQCDGAGSCLLDSLTTACVAGDGCCPPGCTSLNDDDCAPAPPVPTFSALGWLTYALLLALTMALTLRRRRAR